MSTSDLFAVRSKLLRNSFEEFKRIVKEEKIILEDKASNLFLAVYEK